MKVLSIDIETYSSNDLLKGGVYKYVEAEDFEIMLLAYSWNYGPVEVVDLMSMGELPSEVYQALFDTRIIKTAYNAQFERVCLSKHMGLPLAADSWECTMVKAAYFGYPFGLGSVAKAMNLNAEKDNAGKALIKYFSVPCKPTKVNEGRTRNYPGHAPDKWAQFIEYCRQDVVVEMKIRQKLHGLELPQMERDMYWLDQKINGVGVKIDLQLVHNAIRLSEANTERLTKEATDITGLDNPNSPAQLKQWLSDETGEDVTSLTKASVAELSETIDSEKPARILEIRQELAKTSIKKYDAMLNAVCADDRVRGLLQFYGANRTGRWAGRLVQVQNLPQNHLDNLGTSREVILQGDQELAEMFFDNLPDVLSQLIRTAFIPEDGKKLIVVDFSAIEARVIAWLAGEVWRLDVFRTHGKIYEASASQMFGVPVDEITKENPLRQKGKIAELALGYGGSVGALTAMGALNMGLSEEELPNLVSTWRRSNPKIVRLWQLTQDAAIGAIENPGQKVNIRSLVSFLSFDGKLSIALPSGRSLFYQKPAISEGRFGKAITYKGMNQTTRKWETTETFGGKLVENIVQAISRDLLAEAMLRLSDYDIVMHVHDEVVIEADQKDTLEEVINLMTINPDWAGGLPLAADGFESKYYKK